MADICVYCGSSFGTDSVYRAAAERLGALIAEGGHRLVYGGGHVGLMGVVADAVLANEGHVIGVMTEHLVSQEVAHPGLTELEVTMTMHERKARMAELADGVIALPGGFGTFEEVFEVLTWNQIGLISKPVVFCDVGGYYRPMFELITHAVDAGFVHDHHGAIAQRTSDPRTALELALAPPPPYRSKWAV